MHDTGCLRLVHWDDPEGWEGEGGGKGNQNHNEVPIHASQNGLKKSTKSLQAINPGEGVKKREPSYTVGGNAN